MASGLCACGASTPIPSGMETTTLRCPFEKTSHQAISRGYRKVTSTYGPRREMQIETLGRPRIGKKSITLDSSGGDETKQHNRAEGEQNAHTHKNAK